MRSNNQGGFGGRGGPGGPRGGRDPLISKSVVITKGPYKGYLGVCREVYNNMARVELHTNAKIVNVSRDIIQSPEEAANTRGTARPTDSFGAFNGGKTPMYASGSRTPMGRVEGGRTPAWDASSRTPAWNPGSRTPAWNPSSRTPNPYTAGAFSAAEPAPSTSYSAPQQAPPVSAPAPAAVPQQSTSI